MGSVGAMSPAHSLSMESLVRFPYTPPPFLCAVLVHELRCYKQHNNELEQAYAPCSCFHHLRPHELYAIEPNHKPNEVGRDHHEHVGHGAQGTNMAEPWALAIYPTRHQGAAHDLWHQEQHLSLIHI